MMTETASRMTKRMAARMRLAATATFRMSPRVTSASTVGSPPNPVS